MQKLDKKAFDAVIAKPIKGPVRSNEVQQLLDLKVGEGLLISKSEWSIRSLPMAAARNYEARLKMKFTGKVLADESGWAIFRVQ
jgi:hypothetical protein